MKKEETTKLAPIKSKSFNGTQKEQKTGKNQDSLKDYNSLNILVFKNGDKNDGGLELSVTKKRFKNWSSFLNYLTVKFKCPINDVYCYPNGLEIKDFEELEKNGRFFVAANGKYKKMDYGKIPAVPTFKIPTIVQHRYPASLDSEDSMNLYLKSRGLNGKKTNKIIKKRNNSFSKDKTLEAEEIKENPQTVEKNLQQQDVKVDEEDKVVNADNSKDNDSLPNTPNNESSPKDTQLYELEKEETIKIDENIGSNNSTEYPEINQESTANYSNGNKKIRMRNRKLQTEEADNDEYSKTPNSLSSDDKETVTNDLESENPNVIDRDMLEDKFSLQPTYSKEVFINGSALEDSDHQQNSNNERREMPDSSLELNQERIEFREQEDANDSLPKWANEISTAVKGLSTKVDQLTLKIESSDTNTRNSTSFKKFKETL